MAFDKKYIGRVSSSANTDALKVWSYNATSTGSNEAIATVVASAYFNSFQQNLTAGSLSGPLDVGDVMHIHGNDSNGMYVVTAVTTNVTVGSYAAIGSISSSQMNPNLLQYAAVDITAAEFNGMYVTPVELVAAGGANTLLVLESCQLLMTYGAAQFAAGGAVHVQYDLTTLGAGIIASTTQAAADFQDAVSTANGFNQGVVKQPFSTCVNKSLCLANITGAFTTGDSTLVAHTWYRKVPSI